MEKNEETVDHHLVEGEKLMGAKLYDRSMIEFSKAMELDSKVAQKALDGIFQRCLAESNYEGVIAVGSNLLVKHPKNVEMANIIGNAYRKSGDYAHAEKLYEHCLNQEPNDKNSAYNLAATKAKSDLYDTNVASAISEFESLTGFKIPDIGEGEKELQQIQKDILKEAAASEENQESKSSEKEQTDSKEPKDSENREGKLQGELENAKKDDEEKESNVELVPEEIFKYIRSHMDMDSEAAFPSVLALGYYSMANNKPDIAWRALTRASFARPDNETIQSFTALAQASRKGKSDFDKLIIFLGKNPYNRFAHVNLGFLYLKNKNVVLARKYFLLAKSLLDKSKGYYDMQEYRYLGDQRFKEKSYSQALEIYNVVISENETVELLTVISGINIKLENYNDALIVLNRIMELSPDGEKVKETLKSLNQTFLYQGEKLTIERKFAKALEFLEYSGKVERTSALIERMITVCHLMKDEKKLLLLNEELTHLKKQEFEQEQEKHRQEKIQEAQNLEKKQPRKAITSYEEALRLKPDKDVFVRLARLYERTKQANQVANLTERFNKMVEREQRLAQYEQDQIRSKKAKADEESRSEA